MKGGLLVLCLWLPGCVVPSLSALEAERVRTCDADHRCLSGYLCLAGTCKPAAGVECNPGDTRVCGPMGGECRQGAETCTEAATWGTCTGEIGPVMEVCDGKDNDCDGTPDDSPVTPGCGVDAGVCGGKSKACVAGAPEATCSAASFGADYEASESRCDGLDNDCDGMIDESLPPQPCDKTAGVCAGTTRLCTGGSLPLCPASTYLARDAGYEGLETLCDGKDNDCDGFIDSWPARLVTDGGAPIRRKVTAVVLPGTGTAARRDVLTLYEEGNRVVSVVVFANGSLSAPRFPSVTITSVMKASSPALGTNGADVAEAWFEELSGPPAISRMPIAAAGPSGEAIANGSPGVLPLLLPGPGQKVVLSVTATRIVLAYEHLDAQGASTSTIVVASCPKALNNPCTTRTLGAGRNPALLVASDTAIVVYETGARLSIASLAVPSAGTVTLSSSVAFGGSSEHDAALSGTISALDIYSVVPGTPETLWRRSGDCSGACDAATFTSTPSLFTFSTTASSLAVDLNGAARLLAWEDGPSGARVARVMTLLNTTPLDVAPGRRPVPLVAGTAGYDVLYDTDDEVVTRRFCGP